MSTLSIIFLMHLGYVICGDLGSPCFHNKTSHGKCVISNDCQITEVIKTNSCQQPLVCCAVTMRMYRKAETINKMNTSFAVILGYKTKYGIIYKCGGTLIEQNVVLTSVYCSKIPGLPPPTIVKTANYEEIPISLVIQKHNFVILSLAKNSTAKKSCTSPNKFVGKQVYVIGYATLSPDNMLHGSVDKKPGVMKAIIKTNKDEGFTVQSDEKICFADLGGVAVSQDDVQNCPFPVVGILTEWKNCGGAKSVGYFTKLL